MLNTLRSKTSVIALVFISALLLIMMGFLLKITRDTRENAQRNSTFFQQNIFQQSAFINKSIVTLAKLAQYPLDTAGDQIARREILAINRSILTHFDLGLDMNTAILTQLPQDDPLLLRDNLLRLMPRLDDLKESLAVWNRRLEEAGDQIVFMTVLEEYQTAMPEAILVLQEHLNLHTQIQSVFFSDLHDDMDAATTHINIFLYILLALSALEVVLVIVFFTAQRREIAQRQQAEQELKSYQEQLETLVQERTASLEQEIHERGQVEESLRESERYLKKAEQMGRIGHWNWDVSGNSLTWSEELYRIFEVDRDFALTFEKIEAMIHPEDHPYNQQKVYEMLTTSRTVDYEFRILRPDGTVRSLYQTAEVSRDQSGQITKIFGIMQDITVRKQVEKALRESEAKLKALIENTDGSIWAVDCEYRLIIGNPVFHKNIRLWLGREFATGASVFPAQIPQEAQQEWRAFYDRALAGEPFSIETWRRFVDQDHCIEYRFNPIREPDGQISGVTVFGRDITRRKQAEEELKQYQQIVSTTPDAVSLVDREYRYRIVNASYERFSNMAREQLVGLTVAEYLGEEVFQQYIKPHFDRCLQGETIQYEEWFDYPTLGRRFAQVTYLPYRDAQHTITGVVANTRDITELKEAEEQIRASLQEKEVLLREIHHRVKNNLMVVTSLIQMQAEQTTEPTTLALFRDLYNRVLAMSMVHEDLYQSDNLAFIDFQAYLQRLADNIRQGFSQTQAALTIAAEGILLDVHHAIPCGLIVAELVTNACKYAFSTPPHPSPKGRESLPLLRRGPGGGSEIRVEMRKEGNAYTLIVSDNGVGLPPDFDLYASKTLGMSLVRSWTMHQLKGSIAVDNRLGATFQINFTAK